MGIAHRDISLENVLLTDDHEGRGGINGEAACPRLKLIDFGMSTLSQRCSCREIRGKCMYQSPEMHRPRDVKGNLLENPKDGEYDAYLGDTFALGVLIFAMAAKDYPWTSTKAADKCNLFSYVDKYGFRRFLEKRVAKAKANNLTGMHLVDAFSPSLADLIAGLLSLEPESRLTLGEACFEDRPNVWDLPWLAESADGNGEAVGAAGAAALVARLVDDKMMGSDEVLSEQADNKLSM